MKIVEVTWVDPTTDAGWVDDDHSAPLTEMKTYGILILNNKKQLVLAGSYDPSEKKYADRYRFPKGCIKDIQVIKEI